MIRFPSADGAPPNRDEGVAVSAVGVRKAFGQRGVLRGLDLAAAPGEFVAIVGRSGCGKSTVLRLLSGLETVDEGELRIGGDAPRIGGDAPRIGAPAVRMMFQDARLLPWKRALANVELGLRDGDRTVAAQTLAEVGLGDRGGDWPAQLSGGQRQRVALARALVARPRLLLLDEPLGALDALTRIEMQGLIERVWRDHGFTALLVTHDVAEAVALADRVVVLENGRVALDLPVDLPRPRARGSAAFAALEATVLEQVLGIESAADSVLAQTA